MNITVSRELFLHPDFKENIEQALCDYLNSLINDEFAKASPDFDFIDECADAINAIREDFVSAVIPVISKREFLAKLGIKVNRVPRFSINIAVAIIMLLTINYVIASATDYDILNEIKESIIELFEKEKEPETTTESTTVKEEISTEATTEIPSTTETTTEKETQTTVYHKTAEGIKAEFDDSFKSEYNVGESFISSGFKVYLLYDDESRREISKNDYKISVPSDFGKTAGYETVTITYDSFKYEFKVRILNVKETPLLTSIYAEFPQGFDFTAEDIDNIDLKNMKVYALFSDTSKKELKTNEYSVDIENISTLFEKKVMITITHQSCTSSFIVFEK